VENHKFLEPLSKAEANREATCHHAPQGVRPDLPPGASLQLDGNGLHYRGHSILEEQQKTKGDWKGCKVDAADSV
jgi:hypothetical protein